MRRGCDGARAARSPVRTGRNCDPLFSRPKVVASSLAQHVRLGRVVALDVHEVEDERPDRRRDQHWSGPWSLRNHRSPRSSVITLATSDGVGPSRTWPSAHVATSTSALRRACSARVSPTCLCSWNAPSGNSDNGCTSSSAIVMVPCWRAGTSGSVEGSAVGRAAARHTSSAAPSMRCKSHMELPPTYARLLAARAASRTPGIGAPVGPRRRCP